MIERLRRFLFGPPEPILYRAPSNIDTRIHVVSRDVFEVYGIPLIDFRRKG